MSKKRTTEEFIQLAQSVHGDKYDYSLVNYQSKELKVDIICPIHGIYSQKASLHLKGSGCPRCSYIQRGKAFKKTTSEFILEANKVHNSFYSYTNFNYIDAHTKGTIICPIHGEFQQKPNDHLCGKGCPKCNMSHLEREIFSCLRSNLITFEYQKRFDWLGKQSLDFYLQDYNVAIECQGKQHFGQGGWVEEYDFDKQKERDLSKMNLCIQNGIRLIYFSHESIEYNELYNQDNTFNDIALLLSTVLHIEAKSWEVELLEYYNSLLAEYMLQSQLDIFCIDLDRHSEKYVESKYQISCLKKSRQSGNMSIHIFEDEWMCKRPIVESRLRNYLGISTTKIYARKCEIRDVSYSQAKIFLEANHIQGYTNSQYNLGLYCENELVSLMTFGNLRKSLGSVSKGNTYELLRFCNKLNTNVIGGASKLLKYFIRNKQPHKIISYCDLRWSSGKLYDILGFRLSHTSRPNYFYIDKFNCKRENRFKYRKDVLVRSGFSAHKSEHEIMLERGIFRIYDCGCNVYIMNCL